MSPAGTLTSRFTRDVDTHRLSRMAVPLPDAGTLTPAHASLVFDRLIVGKVGCHERRQQRFVHPIWPRAFRSAAKDITRERSHTRACRH